MLFADLTRVLSNIAGKVSVEVQVVDLCYNNKVVGTYKYVYNYVIWCVYLPVAWVFLFLVFYPQCTVASDPTTEHSVARFNTVFGSTGSIHRLHTAANILLRIRQRLHVWKHFLSLDNIAKTSLFTLKNSPIHMTVKGKSSRDVL